MEKEYYTILMEKLNVMANILMIKEKEKENIFQKMVLIMMARGKMI